MNNKYDNGNNNGAVVPNDTDLSAWARAVRQGERRALARAITLIESSRTDHRRQAQVLLTGLLPSTGQALRLGISGTPGVGKSTFIEALGLYLLQQGHRLAVLAVDPSSCRSGGSILGDKTRMEQLSQNPRAFIRPSPSATSLGGVTRRTTEAILLCEAAGFDVILIETVGIGQSEVAVAGMTDCLLMLLNPVAGDKLQGIKRGVMELADIVVVNKADGELMEAARRTAVDYRSALGLIRPRHPGWQTPVLTASALENQALDEVWARVQEFHQQLIANGSLKVLRSRQRVDWLGREVNECLKAALLCQPALTTAIRVAEEAVLQDNALASAEAEKIVSDFLQRLQNEQQE